MSLSGTDYVLKLKEKINKQEESNLIIEIEEYYAGANTKATREQMLRLAHYYHLLINMGDEDPENTTKLETYWAIAREKIQKAKESEGRWKEIAQACLIDQHTKAWNMAEYYYEKGSKVLCQMMVTLMDYIIQEKAEGTSILYKGTDRTSYFDLLDEIKELQEQYEECYYFLCAYDYCTEKIASFTNIKEYKQLNKEHERIIVNGLPRKVTECINTLKEIAGDSKKDYFIDICKAFKPEPLYLEELLEECYQKAVKQFQDEVKAMTIFATLVIKTDEFYEAYMKE